MSNAPKVLTNKQQLMNVVAVRPEPVEGFSQRFPSINTSETISSN
jgi:hypothetical protein